MVAHVVFASAILVGVGLSISIVSPGGQTPSGGDDDSLDMWSSTETVPWLAGNAGTGDGMDVNVTCDGRLLTLPYAGIVLKREGATIMVCPNEKAASSTVRRFVQYLYTGKIGTPPEAGEFIKQFEVHSLVDRGKKNDLCNIDFAATVIRNPYDRLRSGYVDKINRVTHVPGKPNATFADFVFALSTVDPKSMNVHWMPISTHCAASGPNRFPNMQFFKMETELDDLFVNTFMKLGFPEDRIRKTLKKIGQVNVNSDDSHDLRARHMFFDDTGADVNHAILHMYKEDFRFGNYTFGKFP